MKILYVNTMGTWGGVATYLHALIKDQVNRGNEVYLLVGSKGQLIDTIRKQLPSVKIILLKTLDRNIHLLDTLKAIFKFRKIVKTINPDIIHLNCIMSGIVGRIGSLGLRPKIIYNAHGWDFEPRVSRKIRFIAKIIEKVLSYKTNKIICVSRYEFNIAQKNNIFKSPNQAVIIYNGSVLKPNKQKLVPHKNAFSISMAARFMFPKDQKLLILSFYKVLKMMGYKHNLYLYLLGDGPNLNNCKELVDKLDLNNHVIFTGMVSNVVNYYYKSNIVMLITKSEAISLSLIEAMSSKRPIIASNVGGIPELINNNGICVNNNLNNISKAIAYLIRHPYLCKLMGKRSYKLYSQYFTQKKMVNKTNDLYKYVLRH